MKTQKQIEELIEITERDNAHILRGKVETIDINAPVALMQVAVESQLKALYWCLGKQFVSKLQRKGSDIAPQSIPVKLKLRPEMKEQMKRMLKRDEENE